MSAREILRLVEKLGCERLRQRGSHVIVRCPGRLPDRDSDPPRAGPPARHAS
ncbi:MAG: type II toxin-antitoxin system HicA family toxin [Acidimicrobiia bacterium]|nr:type II toxin-antitoxin system HicA family toxin [Acidimicrobiia bacterium]